MKDFAGRIAVVTGGGSGMGRTTLQNKSEVHRFGDSANQILLHPHGHRYLLSMPTSVQNPHYINDSS